MKRNTQGRGTDGVRRRAGAAAALLSLCALGAFAAEEPQAAGQNSLPAQDDLATVVLRPNVSIPAVSSSALTLKAWKALQGGGFDEAIHIADECIARFSARAQKQQAKLNDFAPGGRAFSYGALNDVATCLFIKGSALREKRMNDAAKEAFKEILRSYRFAQCWDPKGWFWKVSVAAQDQIQCIDYNVEFGDYTSETLTAKAWKSYSAGRYEAMEIYIRKCLELYGDAARKMQASLNDFAQKGQEFDYWALNDVGTCLYVRAKALQRQGKNKEAAQVYQEIIDEFSFAQCWEPKGWFWKVAVEAKRNLQFCG